MIRNIAGLLFRFLVLISVILLLYTLNTLRKAKRRKMDSLPKGVDAMYSVFKSIPIVNHYISFLESAYYLLYSNRLRAQLMATLYVSMIPSIYVFTFMIFNMYASQWYLTLLGAVLSLLLPVYLLRNLVISRVISTRIKLLKTLSSMKSLLSTNTVDGAFTVLISTTSGPVRLVIEEFLREYKLDKNSAYHFLKTVTGDMSIAAIADYLKAFDMYGIEDYDILKMYVTTGDNLNRIASKSSASFKSCKRISLIAFVGSILFRNMGLLILDGSGTIDTLNIFIYVAVVMMTLSYTLASLFASSTL